MEGSLSAQRFHALADQLNRTPVRTAATTGLKRRDRALTCRFVEKSRTPPTSRGRPGLSQQSAPGGIRTPNLLIRNERERIPLRISASRPVLPEHAVRSRCCCPVSVNARPP